MKHNKKRNTAFIFEVLIRELTKAVIEKDEKKRTLVMKLVKENFKTNNLLSKELSLYKSILDTKDADQEMAQSIIFEASMQRKTIDNRKLFKEQSDLIEKINRTLSPEVFTNFVPNYKDLATVFQIFNSRMKTKEKILLERKLIGQMMSLPESNKSNLKPLDNLTYKTFVQKFNEKYGASLLEEQKNLLKKYITSFEDDGLELKIFLNEEISRLKSEVDSSMSMGEIKKDPGMLQGTKEVLSLLVNTKKRAID